MWTLTNAWAARGRIENLLDSARCCLVAIHPEYEPGRVGVEFPAENAEIADWLAERSGFEPSRPFILRSTMRRDRNHGPAGRSLCACRRDSREVSADS